MFRPKANQEETLAQTVAGTVVFGVGDEPSGKGKVQLPTSLRRILRLTAHPCREREAHPC